MLIDIAEVPEELTPPEIEGVINLASAYRAGAHFVVATREAASVLMKNKSLDDVSRKTFQRMYTEFATMHSAVDKVATYISVGGPPKPNAIRVDLEKFQNREMGDSAQLVCENMSDCELLETMVKWFYPNINVKFIPHHGGGSTTADVLKKVCLRGYLCVLSVVDSDKWSPNDRLGATANAVLKAARKIQRLVPPTVVVLEARELENLIPDEVLSHVCAETTKAPGRQVCEHTRGHGDARYYIDLKNGLSVKKLRALASQTKTSDLWSGLARAFDSSADHEMAFDPLPGDLLKESNSRWHHVKGIGPSSLPASHQKRFQFLEVVRDYGLSNGMRSAL